MLKIVCRTSNRVFVGLPLCEYDVIQEAFVLYMPFLLGRDPDYRQLNEQFTINVVIGARIINLFPKFLRPYARLPLQIVR